jgi:hypothetical protein
MRMEFRSLSTAAAKEVFTKLLSTKGQEKVGDLADRTHTW